MLQFAKAMSKNNYSYSKRHQKYYLKVPYSTTRFRQVTAKHILPSEQEGMLELATTEGKP